MSCESEGKIVEVNDSNFSSVVQEHALVVVDFWAPWCGPCRNLTPALEAIASKYAGKAVIAKMNIDENLNVPRQHGIMSIPTLLFFKNGKLVDKVVGANPPLVETTINKHL